jgi:aryl-alcohol dehydrogenase-like predicted oxidoreductase
MTFGAATKHQNACSIIDRAIDSGINFFDTANAYGRGNSEEVVGQALKANRKRKNIVLATKVYLRMADDDPNAAGNSRRHIIEQCEASLHRLQTDYIDLYQIHRPQSDIPIDETLRALDDLIRAGKVRYIGCSTFGAWQIVESLWVAKELGLNRFVCEQPPYNLLDRRIERELLPMAQTYGVAVIPWSPIGGGLLTGKYRLGKMPEVGRYANVSDLAPTIARRFTPKVFRVVEKLDPIAAEKRCTLAQLSLAWVLGRPGVTSPIIGPRTMEQFEDNLGALEVDLSDAELSQIDGVVPPQTMVSPFYEADFGPHLHRCP